MSLMPILDGANYGLWSKAMKAYLISIALWGYVSTDISAPATATDGTAHPDLPEWIKHDQQAMGSLILCVAPFIQQDVSCFAQFHVLRRAGMATGSTGMLGPQVCSDRLRSVSECRLDNLNMHTNND